MQHEVITVQGPVDAGELGVTLPHEHIFIDMLKEARVEGVLGDAVLMEQELRAFKDAGGRTVVDCTNIGMGRDPLKLRTLSEATGLNIVVGTGFYRHPYLDRDWFDRSTVDDIAAVIVGDIAEGIDGTDVRAGIIGEVGCDRYVSAAEERSFRAAARAHRQTGLTVTTHAARWPIGGQQLDLLEEEGVDPRRVIIGHCDRVHDQDYHLAMARRGAFVAFDGIRPVSAYDIDRSIRYIRNVVDQGYIDQLLLSHDVCMRGHLRAYGGGGYSFLLDEIVPRLLDQGLSQEQIDILLVRNPRRALTGQAPNEI